MWFYVLHKTDAVLEIRGRNMQFKSVSKQKKGKRQLLQLSHFSDQKREKYISLEVKAAAYVRLLGFPLFFFGRFSQDEWWWNPSNVGLSTVSPFQNI